MDAVDGLPMVSTQAKLGRADNALFAYYTPGITTTGMDWCHSHDRDQLERKVKQHLARSKEREIAAPSANSPETLGEQVSPEFDMDRVHELLYRPFSKKYYYHDLALHEVLDRSAEFFGVDGKAMNTCILLVDGGAGRPLTVCASDMLVQQRFAGPGTTVRMVARHRIGADGRRSENITDHGLERFREHYGQRPLSSLADGVDPRVPSSIAAVRAARAQGLKRPEARPPVLAEITHPAVFHYVYAVLHDPLHPPRHTTGSFIAPHIPLRPDFEAWSDRGRKLVELHTGFEMVEPWPLEVRTEHAGLARGTGIKATVLVDKERGSVQLDRYTTVEGVPGEAWSYHIGDRSALEWVLEHWKERLNGRPYTAADGAPRYMEQLDRTIQRIKRVCRVSMETHRIRKELAMLAR